MATILLIEDEELVRMSVTDALEQEGFSVLTASDGEKGVELAKTHLPDLIVCDIMMPGLDGYKVLEKLQQLPKTAIIPFIFLTAKNNFRKGMKMGADDYVIKPFDIKDLISTIKIRLEKRLAVSRQLDNLRKSMNYMLPHRIRKTLSAIRGSAELLLQAPTLKLSPENVAETAQSVYENEMQLERLVENYLLLSEFTLTHCDAAKMEIWQEDKEFFTKEIIKNIVLKKIDNCFLPRYIRFALTEEPLQISVNAFMKIMDELLENAIKFSEDGTPIEVITKSDDNNFRLSIKDYGIGMNEAEIDQLHKIMDSPIELAEDDDAKNQPSGLGLFVVSHLAELNNGELQIESEKEEGTQVSVVFRKE
jgi:DNA-binding response OmpR family regulator/anti-sigma regulatory factor (Ser/Thr protein kinase)